MTKYLPDIEVLPADDDEASPPSEVKDLVLAPYVDVHHNSAPERVLESDMKVLNNHLIANDFALQNASSTAAIVALAGSACKLIEVRRKVKGLQYGAPSGPQGKVWEDPDDD